MRLACGICLSSQSDARAKGTDPNDDWVAVTDCGHVYHAVSLYNAVPSDVCANPFRWPW